MTIRYLETVESTQSYLKNILKNRSVFAPYAVVSKVQTAGKGSRNSSWLGLDGNLFLSFCINIEKLPNDLKLESASIYFAYILKDTLNKLGSKVWLKWPNDFYINNLKIGGMITNIIDTTLICGVGLNLKNKPSGFEKLDINICIEKLLKQYFINIEKSISWKQIFSKYKLEFYESQNFSTHNNSLKLSLQSAILNSDGSITINGERIDSRR